MWCCRTLLAVAVVVLAACGFEPLYGERPGAPNAAVAAMAETRIALIADRSGQELRNALLDRLTPRGQPARPRYELEVGLTERRDNLGISRDDTATYARLTLTASYRLREIASGRVVTSGQSRWTNGFTVVASHFANLTSEADARSRGLREIGDDIRQQLALHFSKPAGA
jgi:LPS-assembly lipoprotein